MGVKDISAVIGEALRSAQLAISSKDGYVAAAHATSRYIGEASHRWVIFKADVAKAFNCLWRDVLITAARGGERPLALQRLLWQAYSEQTCCQQHVFCRGTSLCHSLLVGYYWQYASETENRVQRKIFEQWNSGRFTREGTSFVNWKESQSMTCEEWNWSFF